MERVLDDLEQIHFSMTKANQVLRDMTRGIASDRRACSWQCSDAVEQKTRCPRHMPCIGEAGQCRVNNHNR